jgi:hypothetical protein
MVRDDCQVTRIFSSPFLLNEDYDVTVALSLEVNDSGGLSPPTLIRARKTFVASNARFSEVRGHTLSENMGLSTRKIYSDWKAGKSYLCPPANTPLAGSLGLKDLVSMDVSSPNLDETLKRGQKSVFSGTVKFVFTKTNSLRGELAAYTH